MLGHFVDNGPLENFANMCTCLGRAGLVQAVESYHMWPEGPMFESRSPRIAQARIRLATNTLPQTPYRAGALCTGYAPMECVQGWRTIMFPQIRYTSKQNHLKHISNHASVSDTYTLSISVIHSTLQCVNKRVQSTEAKHMITRAAREKRYI